MSARSRGPQGGSSHRWILLLFGTETVLWPMAAKKGSKWHGKIVESADRFTVRWHRAGTSRGGAGYATYQRTPTTTTTTTTTTTIVTLLRLLLRLFLLLLYCCYCC